MTHTLTRLCADIGHHAIAFNATLAGHIGDHFEDMGNKGAVLAVDRTHRGNVRLGDHQKIN